jgi:LDH2 family malate/lactate/ureidoglycolate dehydrogenase
MEGWPKLYMTKTITVQASRLHDLYVAMGRSLGASTDEATIFAQCYVRADLRGRFTAGAAVVPYIVSLIQQGLMNFGTELTIVRDEPAFAVIDGGDGVGSVVCTRAMQLAVDKAKLSGVGCVWVRRGGDFGMAANHSLQAAEEGQVGIAMRNGSPRVAPWGGREPFFGTCPISVAIPAGDERPIVIDMSAGSMSVGQTIFRARDGARAGDNAFVSDDGRYTSNASEVVIDPLDRESALRGAIASLGHRGYGWLLMVELFAGLLAGMGSSNKNDFQPTKERPWREGSFLMAVNIERLLPPEEFAQSVDELIRALRAVAPADGFEAVRVPGELADACEERYLRQGIPIRAEVWTDLCHAAEALGVSIEPTDDVV